MKFLGTYKAQDRYKLYYLNRAYKDKFINGKLLNCGEMYPIGNTPFAFSALDNKIIKEFQEIVLNFIIDDAKEMALHPNKKNKR